MLTIADIDKMFPETHDGSLYSDVYKAVYGIRPRGVGFNNIEEFNEDFKYLIRMMNKADIENAIRQKANFEDFVCRVDGIMQMVRNCDRNRAIEIIADAEGEADAFKFYGYEILEYNFNLKYGSIKNWLEN